MALVGAVIIWAGVYLLLALIEFTIFIDYADKIENPNHNFFTDWHYNNYYIAAYCILALLLFTPVFATFAKDSIPMWAAVGGFNLLMFIPSLIILYAYSGANATFLTTWLPVLLLFVYHIGRDVLIGTPLFDGF